MTQPTDKEMVEDFNNKINTLIGYLEVYARGDSPSSEIYGVIEEANEWIKTDPFSSLLSREKAKAAWSVARAVAGDIKYWRPDFVLRKNREDVFNIGLAEAHNGSIEAARSAALKHGPEPKDI